MKELSCVCDRPNWSFSISTVHSSKDTVSKLEWYNFETVQRIEIQKWDFRICKQTSALILFFSPFPRTVILMEASTQKLENLNHPI